jgi:hypothetical protein
MTVRRLLAATAIVVAASMSESYAGPCAQEIDRVQAKIDARLEAKAAAGLSAPESPAATAHHQPTPESIAAAEARLGDLPPERVTGPLRPWVELATPIALATGAPASRL